MKDVSLLSFFRGQGVGYAVLSVEGSIAYRLHVAQLKPDSLYPSHCLRRIASNRIREPPLVMRGGSWWLLCRCFPYLIPSLSNPPMGLSPSMRIATIRFSRRFIRGCLPFGFLRSPISPRYGVAIVCALPRASVTKSGPVGSIRVFGAAVLGSPRGMSTRGSLRCFETRR